MRKLRTSIYLHVYGKIVRGPNVLFRTGWPAPRLALEYWLLNIEY